MEELAALAKAKGLLLFEDAAQAQGARRHGRSPLCGHWGLAAATSFYPGKEFEAPLATQAPS